MSDEDQANPGSAPLDTDAFDSDADLPPAELDYITASYDGRDRGDVLELSETTGPSGPDGGDSGE